MALENKRPTITINEQLLNKKISVKTILNIFNDHSTMTEEQMLLKLNEVISKKIKQDKVNSRKKPLIDKNTLFPQIALEFKEFFSRRGYAPSTLDTHMRNLRQFVSFLNYSYANYGSFNTILELHRLTKIMIVSFEEFLIEKLNTEQIQGSTVYRYLSTVKLLLQMLHEKSISTIHYVIPEALRKQGKRSNDYIETEQINTLIESVVKSNSQVKFRDMCVILLTMEIGCRPIEITNLKIDDLIITERRIRIHSRKSGTRTLKISKDLSQLLKRYLEIRDSLQITNTNMFINSFGEPITTNGIRSIFERANKKAFNERRFNPKALRHTYATNALDNENDFDEVSASMGHLHRCSTEWYIHRSVQRMLRRALPHNPLNQIMNGE
ncbi:hypothetical protein BVG16_07620 [Paenibacillus selenitireducens]|uniref:Tyr recombinase domain-containing protein n=1 Tax=Paenibacillus selenitireducens TaxID=1324314 RepID=A0A1T2XL22_9BACL|nr:site-specific integrase [Paenibacillus selenitireducens]OPA80580.1 hypothetical protein BVG16_07620 [Paenibacillus selenitireducens]